MESAYFLAGRRVKQSFLPDEDPMTDLDLKQARLEKWHLDGRPVRTLDDARSFLESVGFCLMYPLRPAVPVPTFVGAWVGAGREVPAPGGCVVADWAV